MKLIEQLLYERGAPVEKSFTVVEGFGAYFKCVKSVAEYSEEKITLIFAGKKLGVCGKNLIIERYFESDLLIRGEIKSVSLE